MGDYRRSVDVDADPDVVRWTVAERGDLWWTTNAIIDSRPGGFCHFRFPAAGFHAGFRVVRNDGAVVEWFCIDSVHPRSSGYTDRHEWVGTTVRFTIEPKAHGAVSLHFEHAGLKESLAHYVGDSDPWRFYLDSIKKVAEKSQGAPFAGGRPGTRTAGLVPVIVFYAVAAERVDEAKAVISRFIAVIEKSEPETFVYRSYQHAADAGVFVHYMLFKNEAARARHSASEHCTAFRVALHPLCTKDPEFFSGALFDEAAG